VISAGKKKRGGYRDDVQTKGTGQKGKTERGRNPCPAWTYNAATTSFKSLIAKRGGRTAAGILGKRQQEKGSALKKKKQRHVLEVLPRPTLGKGANLKRSGEVGLTARHPFSQGKRMEKVHRGNSRRVAALRV